jgi:hypothetical protein
MRIKNWTVNFQLCGVIVKKKKEKNRKKKWNMLVA